MACLVSFVSGYFEGPKFFLILVIVSALIVTIQVGISGEGEGSSCLQFVFKKAWETLFPLHIEDLVAAIALSSRSKLTSIHDCCLLPVQEARCSTVFPESRIGKKK